MMEIELSFPTDEELCSYLKKSLDARALLSFRLSGGTKFLTDQLNQQYQHVLRMKTNIPTSSSTVQQECFDRFLRLLSVFVSFCENYDFSADFAAFGGHMLLKKMLTSDCDIPDVMDAVESIVGSIGLSGCTFPMKSILSDNPTQSVIKPAACTFAEAPKSSKEEGESTIFIDDSVTDNMEFTVHLRSIPQSVHGTGQHAVGYLLWSSAVILSRFIVQNEGGIIRNKTVLECGAGLGLCGIVAGRYATSVTISDFSEILVQNLQYNIEINRGPELLEGHSSPVADTCTMDVYLIDWNALTLADDNETPSVSVNNALGGANNDVDPPSIHTCSSETSADTDILYVSSVLQSETDDMLYSESIKRNDPPLCRKYDVIIGSDLVYCESDNTGILKLVTNFLSDNGIFVFVVPKPRHRYGTEHLVPVLQKGGFEVYSRCVAHSTCTSAEVTGEELSTVYWKSARTSEYLNSEEIDKFSIDNISFSDYLENLCIDNDHFVSHLDEHPFVAWNLIIGHRN